MPEEMCLVRPDLADEALTWEQIFAAVPQHPPGKRRAAIYCRLSKQEMDAAGQAEGYSLETQQQRSRSYVRSKGWEVAAVYEDVQSGGTTRRRRNFHRLMRAIRRGEVDVLVIDRIDRLHRNLPGLLNTINYLREHDVTLVSVSEQIGFDTRWGKLVLYVLGAVAELYLDTLSEDTKKAKRTRYRKGLPNGSFRLGYCNGRCSSCTDPNGPGYCPLVGQPDRNRTKVQVPHPIEQVAVQMAFRLYATGRFSDNDIARRLNAYAHRLPDGRVVHLRTKGRVSFKPPGPFTKDAVRAILCNPFYAGFVGYAGTTSTGKKLRRPTELRRGQHEPLVSAETFNRCRLIREGRRTRPQRARRPARTYPLSGLLYCAQEKSPLRAFSSNQGRNRYYRDALCQEKLPKEAWHQPNVRAAVVERQVAEMVGRLRLPGEWRRRIAAYLMRDEGLDALLREKIALRDQWHRSRELYHSREISRAAYEETKRKVLRKLAQLDPQGHDVSEQARPYLEDLSKLWSEATAAEQNRLLRLMVSALYVRGERIESWEFLPPFDRLLGPGERRPPLQEPGQEDANRPNQLLP
jgi:DNA invertase Pin-like site-specific DNA recombinase